MQGTTNASVGQGLTSQAFALSICREQQMPQWVRV